MGANRQNMYLVSRRFAPAYILWENENIRDQYWLLIKAYQTSKKTSQDGKEGHERHENNITQLSKFLNEHQKNFKHR